MNVTTRIAATVKDGAAHLASLRDGRAVFLEGQQVADVTTHPAFRNACAAAAAMYDFQARPENLERMTFADPEGHRVNRAWQLPTSYAELVQRREALVAWAELSGGFLGRSPDHVASALGGQVMGLEVIAAQDARGAAVLADYYAQMRAADAFLTYVIINPQADRSKDWGQQQGEDLVASIVDEDSTGLTIRGAKMLGTSSIMANEVFVASLQPLKPGEENLAFACGLPMNAKGLKVLSRKSYEQHAVSAFDNPLSTHFDENDAVLFFDDVKVPWDRVFHHRNPDLCRAQFHDTPGHIYQNYQAQIRLTVKLRFLLGVARRITETIGTVNMPPVRDLLGKLASQASVVQAMLYGIEAAGQMRGDYFVPDRHLVYAAQVHTQELYGQFVASIRELAGGSLIMLPSSVKDYANAEMAKIIRSTQSSAVMSPDERVRFLKLAWDAVGSEYASRHQQYEMFYAGAPFVTRGHAFRTADWAGATGLVGQVLDRTSPPLG